MRLSTKIDNKKKDIVILGKGLTLNAEKRIRLILQRKTKDLFEPSL